MATLDSRYRINGLVDTSRPVFENLETITNSCATWLSYDGLSGKWSVVINQSGSAVASFDDDSIIGGINLSTNNLGSFYNECEVRFHNLTLRDKEDYVLLAIPESQRLPNEPTNRLIINAPMVNNQIQAQLIGLIELKQSRLDKTIEFRTDYSRVNLEAGDIISVTNAVYGWTNQEFRILRITEVEESGSIVINITAQEYNDSIYSTADLYLYIRETETGLIELDPLVDTSPITPSTAVLDANGDSMLGLLGANALLALLKGLMEDDATGSGSLFEQIFDVFQQDTGANLLQSQFFAQQQYTLSEAFSQAQCTAMAVTSSPQGVYDPANANDKTKAIYTQILQLPSGSPAYQSLNVDIKTPTFFMDYQMKDQNDATQTFTIPAQPAFIITLFHNTSNNYATSTAIQEGFVDWTTNRGRISLDNPPEGFYWCSLGLNPTYALNMNWPRTGAITGAEIYFYNFVTGAVANGAETQFSVSLFY